MRVATACHSFLIPCSVFAWRTTHNIPHEMYRPREDYPFSGCIRRGRAKIGVLSAQEVRVSEAISGACNTGLLLALVTRQLSRIKSLKAGLYERLDLLLSQ
jgi:hypothetical protein